MARRSPSEQAEPVTVTIARTVAAGRAAEFEEWSNDLTSAASRFPGFLGAGMLRPSHLGDPWHVVFRFDDAVHLQDWEASPERAAVLATGQHLVESTDMHRVSGLETWFELPGRTAPAPAKWKMFLVSGTVFFLLNLTLSLIYGWSLASWPLPLHIIVISYPVTAIATWLVMPRVARLLQGWLFGARRHLVNSSWPPGLPPLVESEPITGGMVCETSRGRLADGRAVVVKRSPYPAAVEADGLRALSAAGVPVPEVLGIAGRTLVLAQVSGPPDWPALGCAVADMHRHLGPAYGWHQNNRSGRFIQHNDWSGDWSTFYAERRVRVHLSDPAVPEDLCDRLSRACDGPLPALLPPNPVPSLTHGDLWLGNIVDGRWLIDPEVSYADRELDLAYMERSQSLPAEFWQAYQEKWPFDAGYPERRPALQLHHLLLQIRHFGAERYRSQLTAVLDSYGW